MSTWLWIALAILAAIVLIAIFSRRSAKSESANDAGGGDVKENPWGVQGGMSVKKVNQLLVKNGFQPESVDISGQFGGDTKGYQYPCWRNTRSGTSVTSTFKNGKLLDFSWW